MSSIIAVEHARTRILAKAAGAADMTAIERAVGCKEMYVKERGYRVLESVVHQLCPMTEFARIMVSIDMSSSVPASLLHSSWIREILDDAGKHYPGPAQECAPSM